MGETRTPSPTFNSLDRTMSGVHWLYASTRTVAPFADAVKERFRGMLPLTRTSTLAIIAHRFTGPTHP